MKIILLTAFVLFAVVSEAQVSFSKFPKDSTIVPRSTVTNLGTIVIAGSVKRPATPFKKILVDRYRNDTITGSFVAALVYTKNVADFSFTINIPAELAEYKFKVHGLAAGIDSVLKTASFIAAGDAFIIQGQSNAAAGAIYGSSNAENQSEFIRVWGSGNSNGYIPKWNIANGDIWDWGGDGNAGEWSLRLARQVLDTYHIPVVIFNGANSGQPVNWFQRDSIHPFNQNTNYGRLLQRITETGFINNIRAIFWYQGEADSYSGNDIIVYKSNFYNLYNGWKRDYPGFEHLYIIQIKQGCGAPLNAVNKIQQAHFELSNEIANTTIYATNGTEHAGDECHYNYNPGYRTYAQHLFPVVNRDIYKARDTTNIESPQIVRAVQTGAKELTFYFKKAKDSYVWEAGTQNDFVFDTTSAKVVAASIADSTLIFRFSKKVTGLQTVSYTGHQTGGSPCIRNINGEGLVGFYKMPVVQPALKDDFSEDIAITKSILIKPNPVQDKLFVQYELSKSSNVFISVSDATGRIVKTVNTGTRPGGKNVTTINVDALATGIYYLKLQAGSLIYVQKFIKN